MSGEAVYLLSSLLLSFIVYILVTRGRRSFLGYLWRRWRVFMDVWLAQVGSAMGGDGRGRGGGHVRLSDVVEAPPWEQEVEKPKPFVTDRHEDVVSVSAADREGRAVVLRAARLSNRRASVFLAVIDKDGTVYTLPNQPDTGLVNVDGEGWGGAGLSVTCVDPMRLWRVKFSGMLRRGAKEEYITEGSEEETEEREAKKQQQRKRKQTNEKGEASTDQDTKQKEKDEEDEDEGDVVHARFDFLWRSIRGPVEFSASISPLLLSRSLAPHLHASPWDYMEEERDGYEQWGCLHGTIRLRADEPLDTWYLRGPRRHRWGLPRVVGLGLSSRIYFDNGDQFSFRARCLSPSGPQYMSGYLRKASGKLHVMTACDLDLTKLDRLAVLGNNLLIKFTAGGHNYEVWQQLGQNGVKYHTGDPWTCAHTVYNAPAAATHTYGRAMTTLSCRYTALCPVPERESLPSVEAPAGWALNGVPLVVTLEDPRCRDLSLAGGKGASLAMLTAYKELVEPEQEPYEVPPGVVVTSRAWEVQLAACHDLQQAIRSLRMASAAGQAARIKEACARVVKTCEGAKVCKEVEEELFTSLEEVLDVETTRMAVRSSGCSEDGAETSAAGQNVTVLGVAGRRDLLKALTRCWASLFAYHSVEYRRQRGQPVESGMAVVVQEMAAAAAAGVMFTVDPITGDPSAITITANYGLGESVVSGSSEPDTVVVRRSWRDGLRVSKRSLGGKASKCVLKEGGGTQEVDVSVEERREVCVSDVAALSLARVALFLHEAFAGPRDIEFALLKGGEVVVLQARPITSLNTWTEYELIHEQDSGTITDQEAITKGNTGEVFPDSTSPLSLSVVALMLDFNFQQQWSAVDVHHTELCPIYYTHVFLNIHETMHRLMDEGEAGRLVAQTLDMTVFGHYVTTPEMLRRGMERFGVATLRAKMRSLLKVIYDKVLVSQRGMRKFQEKYKAYQVEPGRAVSAKALYAEINRRLPDLLEVTSVHMSASRVASTTQSIAFIMLANGKTELSTDNVLDMGVLLSSCTGVESADVPSALKELSHVISESEEAEEFLAMSTDEARVWLHSHPGPVGSLFRQFLAKHGHRSIKEFDLRSLSWRLDPYSLVATLQVMTKHCGGEVSNPGSPADLDEILNQLRSPLSRNTKRALRFLLPMIRNGVVQREASKSLLIKVVDGLRDGYRELGTLLVNEGRLPDPDLVFFLKHNELGQLVAAPSPALVVKAAGKKRLFAHLDSLKFPEVNLGTPVPNREQEEDEEGAARRPTGSVVLKGSTVYQGRVKATARVVTRIADADTIQAGDILVTVSTDIGWSPYFTLLSGVVTELGGLLSHGAVVAREYGLPCLVGVEGATNALRSGDQVLLDSTSGTLTLLKPSSS